MKNDAMKNALAGENKRPLMLAPAFKDYIWGGERLKRDWGKRTDLSPLAEKSGVTLSQTGDDLPTVIDSTASPYKFSKSVLTAVLEGNTPQLDEFDMVEELHRITGAAVPAPLAALKDKAVRFTQVCDRENMSQMVFQLLNL